MAKRSPAEKAAELAELLARRDERRSRGEKLPAKGPGSVSRLEYLQRDQANQERGGYGAARRARERGETAGDRRARPNQRTTYRYQDRTVVVDVPNTAAGRERLASNANLGRMPGDALVSVTFTVKTRSGLQTVETPIPVATRLAHKEGPAGAGADAFQTKLEKSPKSRPKTGTARPKPYQWSPSDVVRIRVEFNPAQPYKYGSDEGLTESLELARGQELTAQYEALEARSGAQKAAEWIAGLSELDLAAIVKFDEFNDPIFDDPDEGDFF